MAETPGQSPNAASICDDLSMFCHVRGVRYVRTQVKGVESVPSICDGTYMQNDKTTGQILLQLKLRTGDLSLEEIAKRGGYSGKSSVQEYFKASYDAPLGGKVALKLAKALAGLGSPPITESEITSLAAVIPMTNARPVEFEGASLERVRDDLPVFGTALGAEMLIDGERIEQTTLNTGDIIEYRKRPPVSHGVEKVYGLYVQGGSMYPAHRDGAFLFAQRDARLRVDDDVVVYLRPKDESDDGERASCVLVKRLVKRSAQFVELEQYNPAKIFRIDMKDVLQIDRVLTADDYT